MINKNQTNLINKRIFLVKIQAVIFLVGMALAMYFGSIESASHFDSNEIYIVDILFGAVTENISYKIHILSLSVILFVKAFYFENLRQRKTYLWTLLLNLLPFILYIFFDKTPYDAPILIFILYSFCIFIYTISLYLMYKFYKLANEVFLFKSFIFINILAIYMLILYGLEILNSLSMHRLIFIEEPALISVVFYIFWFTLPLSVWLSIPLNLIKEYSHFKQKINKTKFNTKDK